MPAVKSASDLYGLALEQFTAERNDLVKRLKVDGDKEAAARVGKLRKPTLPAWAVNQLVRTQPKQIKALFATGDAVARAQGKGQADKLREAAADQREQLAELMDRAEGLLDADGRTLAAGVLERVSETLRAAAIDPECRAQVQDGCLTRELRFTGLSGFSAAAAATPRESRRAEEQPAQQRQKQIKTARDEERQARHDLQEAQKQLRQADRELASAQGARDQAAKNVESAEEALAEATEQLEQLQRGGK
jgi:hypothetical protein